MRRARHQSTLLIDCIGANKQPTHRLTNKPRYATERAAEGVPRPTIKWRRESQMHQIPVDESQGEERAPDGGDSPARDQGAAPRRHELAANSIGRRQRALERQPTSSVGDEETKEQGDEKRAAATKLEG